VSNLAVAMISSILLISDSIATKLSGNGKKTRVALATRVNNYLILKRIVIVIKGCDFVGNSSLPLLAFLFVRKLLTAVDSVSILVMSKIQFII